MPNNRKKISTPTAVTNYSVHDLSCTHLTTSNFMEYGVAKILPVVPKHGLKLAVKGLTKLLAMPRPTLGNAQMHYKWFFVPYRVIYPAFNEFYNDTQYVDGNGDSYVPTHTPLIKNSELVKFLISSGCATQKLSYPTVAAYRAFLASTAPEDIAVKKSYDISVVVPAGQVYTYKLTPYGRRCLKILESLGYKVSFNLQDTEIYHSALNFLALVKVYMDWYYPSAYMDDERSMSVNRLFNYDSSDENLDEILVAQEINEVFSVISTVCYDDDYFTNAWDNPVGPNGDSFTEIQFKDPTTNGSTVSTSYEHNTPVLSQNDGGDITAFGVRLLRSITDYSKRHQLAGSRVIDRYLAQWGIKLPAEKLKRSYFLGGNNDNIRFSDVFSHADSEGSQLGDYAGAGEGRNNSFIDFAPQDEHGVVICVSTIIPHTEYYQGQDRMTLCTTKFDYYNPEFDALGVQAMSTRELFVPKDSGKYDPVNWDALVWGFVPRYAHYKRPVSQLTGDYVLNSLNTGEDSWHLYRDVSGQFPAANSLEREKHDVSFLMSADSVQYDRIFYNTANTQDHFKVLHVFNIESTFPGKSMYEEYEFEDEGKSENVSLDLNGVKAN